MKIGFDAKRLFLNNTGLGNYSRFVVDSLVKNHPENQYFLYTPNTRKNKGTEHYFSTSNVHIIQPKGLLKFGFLKSIWRTFFISFDTSVKELDVFHGLSHELPLGLPPNVKKVLTVHDVIFLRFPEYFPVIDRFFYKLKLASACEKADLIIAISEETKKDIIAFFQVDESKIQVIYQGCNEIYFDKVSDERRAIIMQKYNLPDKYILNVGSIEERKNVGLLIEALAQIPENDRPDIVLIGKRTPYTQKVEKLIQKYKLEAKVHILPFISFEDLSGIYQQAKLFAYTSKVEGFGIPILEAMVSEIPVLVPKGSCFTEVVGPDGVYFEPENSLDLANKIQHILKSETGELIIYQTNYAKRFFEDSQKKYYRLLEDLLKK